eukprot:19054-Alexandrium_andersonii.AAC.1
MGSFSTRSILWLSGDPDIVRCELAMFKQGLDDWEWLKANHRAAGIDPSFVARSQFNMVCVQQLVEACKEVGWDIHLSTK